MNPSAISHLLVGVRTYGTLVILPHTEHQSDSDQIVVDITARYYTENALNQARVCKLETKDGGEGIGLYVSDASYLYIAYLTL